MPIITIDARDFLRGSSTTDELADGGFSPLSKGMNLFAEPGLILPGQAPVDQAGTSAATKGIFAWSTHHSNFSPGIGRGLGSNDNLDGKFYTLNDGGGAILAASDTGRDYDANISDLIRYGSSSEQFSTSKTNIGKSNFNFSTNIFDWWTATLSLTALKTDVSHHMIQYGAILYITDKNMIHSWDGSAGAYNVLDLPVGFVITDVVVYNNLIYISAGKFDPFGGGESIDNRIFTWDGFSASFLDEYPLQEKIDTLIVFGGTLFVTTASYFGYFSGSTVSPLYPLTSSVKKYQIAITNDRIYLIQGANLLCYGNPIISRPKFFSFPLKHTSSLVGITSYRSGKIVYSYASGSGAWSDVNGSDQTGGIFYSNRLPLRSNAYIRGVIIESQALASGSSQTIAFINDSAETKTVGTYSHAAFGAVSRRHFDVNNKASTLTVQMKVTFGATPNKGIRRIHIWYEPIQLRARS